MPELQRYVNSNIGHRRNVCIGHNNGKDHRSYNGENRITNEYENTDWRDKKKWEKIIQKYLDIGVEEDGHWLNEVPLKPKV